MPFVDYAIREHYAIRTRYPVSLCGERGGRERSETLIFRNELVSFRFSSLLPLTLSSLGL